MLQAEAGPDRLSARPAPTPRRVRVEVPEFLGGLAIGLVDRWVESGSHRRTGAARAEVAGLNVPSWARWHAGGTGRGTAALAQPNSSSVI